MKSILATLVAALLAVTFPVFAQTYPTKPPADGYMTKPCSKDLLVDTIRQVLRLA